MKFMVNNALLVLLLSISSIFAQTTHDVSISGFSFVPSELSINTGDAVRWTNDGGLHNVLADDNTFTSGPVSTSIWVYTHVFNSEGEFRYYCEAHGGPGGTGMAGIIQVGQATGVDDDVLKIDYNLEQNYPNPFNPATTIQYSIPESEYVTLKIYNITGAVVKELISEHQPGGNYIIEFNAADLASGIYFYQLTAGDFINTKRMILLK
jgi:plastocyanin